MKAAQKKKILHVDDDEALTRSFQRAFQKHGFDIATAGTVSDGFRRLKSESFDLCITDLGLPDADGTELMRLIRSDGTLKRLPIIVYSGKADDNDPAVRSFSPAQVFQKPTDFDVILKAVNEVLK